MTINPLQNPASRAVAGRTAYLILHNTSEVVTPDAGGHRLVRHPKGAVVFQDGRVLEVGNASELLKRHGEARPINAGGKLVTPGLVDCHTHMIFAGHRAAEFQRRLAGEDYAAIAAAGGGIKSTVASTLAERDDTLEKSLATRLERWRAAGCTTVEVKSGYGANLAGEMRLLELMRGAAQRVPVRMHRTALLAHHLPESYRERRERYIDEILEHTLPEIRRRELASAVCVVADPDA